MIKLVRKGLEFVLSKWNFDERCFLACVNVHVGKETKQQVTHFHYINHYTRAKFSSTMKCC